MHDPYESGVLDKDVHERLVANLDGFARDAGVQRDPDPTSDIAMTGHK